MLRREINNKRNHISVPSVISLADKFHNHWFAIDLYHYMCMRNVKQISFAKGALTKPSFGNITDILLDVFFISQTRYRFSIWPLFGLIAEGNLVIALVNLAILYFPIPRASITKEQMYDNLIETNMLPSYLSLI